MPNAQEYINEKYPNKEEVREINGYRKEITDELIIADFPQVEEISVGNNQLTQLHLKNCPQLIELYCGNSKLTELTITNCPNLQKIYAPDNQLTNLDLSNNQKLKILRISNNNFSSNLSFCHHLVNLKELYLGDNNFTGSLEPLRNLSKLEALSINNNTNLNQGLEFFPDNARNYTSFSCEGTIFKKQLKPYGGYYRGVIKKWRAAQNSF
jgi:Leucine-rich repeat (LRR) protein